MSMRLLDCTVRDGGYINDWNFGNKTIKSIFKKLVAGAFALSFQNSRSISRGSLY